MKTTKENKKNKNILLGLILLLLAVGLFFMAENDVKKSVDVGLQSKETQELVNRHLRETSQDMILKQQKSQLESQKEILNAEKNGPQQKYNYNPHKLEISQYEENPDFNKAVGRDSKVYSYAQDPNQVVQGKLFQDQAEEKYSEQYKKEYARQFIENARNAGWDIKVDASYRVISAKKLQRAPTYDVFQGEGSGSR